MIGLKKGRINCKSTLKVTIKKQIFWLSMVVHVFLALGRQRQENHKFEVSLSYIERPKKNSFSIGVNTRNY
jgi:hypothetical protein